MISGEKAAIIPLLAVNFIGTLGYSVVLPFLVFVVIAMGGNEIVFGITGAVYSFFQLIGAPVLGKWSDQIGRKKVLLISQAGTALAWVFFLLALLIPVHEIVKVNSSFTGSFILTVPLVVLIIARVLDGLTGGNVSVAHAYLADITSDKEKSRNFGLLSASGNLGYIVGPALAGLLGATFLKEILPVSVALLISLIATGMIFWFLPEPKGEDACEVPETDGMEKVMGKEPMPCINPEIVEKVTFRKILREPQIRKFLLLYFLIYLGFNIFYTAFPLHSIQQLNWDPLDLGIFFSVLSLMMIIVQGPVLNYFSKHYNDNMLTLSGSIILSISFIMMISESIWLIYLAAGFFSLGNGLMWPSFLSLLSKAAGKKNQGSVQGYAGSSGSLASIIGLIAGGIFYKILGPLSFLISFTSIMLVFILALSLPTHSHSKN
jgi:MFS transporter, DHA1 family, tetracycline resistance protein